MNELLREPQSVISWTLHNIKQTFPLDIYLRRSIRCQLALSLSLFFIKKKITWLSLGVLEISCRSGLSGRGTGEANDKTWWSAMNSWNAGNIVDRWAVCNRTWEGFSPITTTDRLGRRGHSVRWALALDASALSLPRCCWVQRKKPLTPPHSWRDGWTHTFSVPRAKCCNIETSKIESMKINLEPPWQSSPGSQKLKAISWSSCSLWNPTLVILSSGTVNSIIRKTSALHLKT